MADLCEGCKTPLSDCGHIGFACLNPKCTYEMDQVIKWMRQRKEQEEREELKRLKLKYEVRNG